MAKKTAKKARARSKRNALEMVQDMRKTIVSKEKAYNVGKARSDELKAAWKLSPENDRIVLMYPPFRTVQDDIDAGNQFWDRDLTNVGEIDYANAVIVADFGIGSDSPIILYYGKREQPIIMYLKWSGNGDAISHSWVGTHESFDQFAADVVDVVAMIERKLLAPCD